MPHRWYHKEPTPEELADRERRRAFNRQTQKAIRIYNYQQARQQEARNQIQRRRTPTQASVLPVATPQFAPRVYQFKYTPEPAPPTEQPPRAGRIRDRLGRNLRDPRTLLDEPGVQAGIGVSGGSGGSQVAQEGKNIFRILQGLGRINKQPRGIPGKPFTPAELRSIDRITAINQRYARDAYYKSKYYQNKVRRVKAREARIRNRKKEWPPWPPWGN